MQMACNNSDAGASFECLGESMDGPTQSDVGHLTAAQKARAERNRQRALLLKSTRQKSPSKRSQSDQSSDDRAIIRVEGVKFIDTGGGFLLEQKDDTEENQQIKLASEPAPIIEPDWPTCTECSNKFMESFLLKHFDHHVCDKCRDNDGLHSLITKTDARNEYLLKDCDFEKREPPLRYLVRRNPHDPRWGDMKLYLLSQVEHRALEVWGSEEQLEEERERREALREKTKAKKYSKKMKELRMSVRSSLYNRVTVAHEHKFGSETLIEEDTYSRECSTCGYKETFEKM